jgi:hypothetical protein
MKNNEKQTSEDPRNQKKAESLSEAELDKVAGGGGPQGPALAVKNPAHGGVSAPLMMAPPVNAAKKP